MTFDKTGTLTRGSFRLVHVELGTAGAAGTAGEQGMGSRASAQGDGQPASCCSGGGHHHAHHAHHHPHANHHHQPGSPDHPASPHAVPAALGEAQVLRLVGSLERGASHPIAPAIVGRAAAQASGGAP